MKTIFCAALLAGAAAAGCTHTQTANGGRPDPNATRRTITGSNIPQPVDRPTANPVFATQPPTSVSRDRPSLAPTEPIVGAGGQSTYRLNEPSTGAGPAGSNPLPSASPTPN